MTCWSCQAENDLGQRQTCVRCGAPLVQTFSVFSRPIVLGLPALLIVCWLAVVAYAMFSHGCH